MKKVAILLAFALAAMSLFGCGQKSNEDPDKTTNEPDNTGIEPGTQYNSVADFNEEEGQSGVWQYYFSGDSGETFDACGSFDDYGTVKGWHPWEGSYIGVGFNQDVDGFLELNTDCYSTDFSGQMGVLAFAAPADGKYVITAKVWNPWSQACDVFTFKKADGTVVLTQDMTEIVDIYAYVTPTDVELKKGDLLYIYCNATGSEWVSAYVDVTMVYEPTDDSVYTVPEVEAPEVLGVEPDFAQEAQYNAYKDFDSANNDGTWVYASTTDGTAFTLTTGYEDRDYGAHEWFNEDASVGVGTVDYFENGEEYIEVNTAGSDSAVTALGFKAPADGTYAFNGYAFNAWGQPTEQFHAVMNGTEAAAIDVADYTKLPNEYSFEVEMKAGDVLYFYCPSTNGADDNGWVSAYIAVFVNVK